MLVSCYVELLLPGIRSFRHGDPRILSAARQTLLSRTGVIEVELISVSGVPCFTVTLDDAAGTGFIPVTTLMAELEGKTQVHIVFAEDDGIKSSLVNLRFRVAS